MGRGRDVPRVSAVISSRHDVLCITDGKSRGIDFFFLNSSISLWFFFKTSLCRAAGQCVIRLNVDRLRKWIRVVRCQDVICVNC